MIPVQPVPLVTAVRCPLARFTATCLVAMCAFIQERPVMPHTSPLRRNDLPEQTPANSLLLYQLQKVHAEKSLFSYTFLNVSFVHTPQVPLGHWQNLVEKMEEKVLCAGSGKLGLRCPLLFVLWNTNHHNQRSTISDLRQQKLWCRTVATQSWKEMYL